MTSNQAAGGPGPVRLTVFEKLAEKRPQVQTGLFVLVALLAAIPITNAILYRLNSLPVLVWGIALTLFALVAAAIYAALPPHTRAVEADRLRVLTLTLGGGFGLATAVLGLILPFTGTRREVFAAGLEKWRAHPWMLIVCALALFVPMVLMFVSLQLARAFERDRAGMRRLVYGYNAVLSSVLLLSALALLNVLAYARVPPFNFFGKTFDWTSTNLYTLSPKTKNFLKELKDPVKIYVLGSGGVARQELETLLDTFRNSSDQISWETISRDRTSPEDLAKLARKYNITEAELGGLLVVYGPEGKELHEFIPPSDLFGQVQNVVDDQGNRTRASFAFKGEDSLLRKLIYLSEGKSKAKVYFLQGHGELDISSREMRDVGIANRSMGELFGRLQEGNYEAKGFQFGLDPKKDQPQTNPDLVVGSRVPTDAQVLVIAGPRTAFPQEHLTALEDYVKREGKQKGKLLVLMDVVVDPNTKKMVQTNLEGFLRGFNVQVNNDRILALNGPNKRVPTEITVYPNWASRNPLARAFLGDNGPVPFRFEDARTVERLPQGGNPNFQVDTLMLASSFRLGPSTEVLWNDKDLKKSPTAVVTEMRENEELRRRAQDENKALSVAVTVSESRLPAGHVNVGTGSVPRLIVFGDATWASNWGFASDPQTGRAARADDNFDLFASSIAWLRERPEDVGTMVPPKERKEYRIEKIDDAQQLRIMILPGVLMLVGILGLGGGVWLVRRR
jgi:hypothetical protein